MAAVGPCQGRQIDKQVLERRRRQAMSGVVPARIAAHFTMAEAAVLAVVGRTCQRCGTCILPLDAIAALAGVSRTIVKNAMRQARILGLVEVKERRRRGLPSMTNIVQIISAEWNGWLRMGGQGGGVRFPTTTDTSSYSVGVRGAETVQGQRGEHGRSRWCLLKGTDELQHGNSSVSRRQAIGEKPANGE